MWVFGEIEGLRWVLAHDTMAFAAHAAARIAPMGAGDRAVLYVTRGAHHNPTRDVARLGGLVTVLGTPQRPRRAIRIAGREFTHTVAIRVDVALGERSGPEVKPLAAALDRVKKPPVWGQYFRGSPIAVSEHDFEVFAAAVRQGVGSSS